MPATVSSPAERIVGLATRATDGARPANAILAGLGVQLAAEEAVADDVLAAFGAEPGAGAAAPVLRVSVAALRPAHAAALALEQLPESGVVHHGGGEVVHLHRDVAARLDRRSGHLHALIRHDRELASWQRAKPLQLMLSVFLADRGVHLVHGGLVAAGGRGALLAGPSGSGKSSTAVAAALGGLEFLGDDCVAVSEDERGFRGHRVYATACLDRAHPAWPRGIAAPAAAPGKEVLGPKAWPALAREAVIEAVVLPRVTSGRMVALAPAAPRDALLALAPSSILNRAVPAAAVLARLRRLVTSVPVFRLDMGPLDEVAPRLRSLLEERAR